MHCAGIFGVSGLQSRNGRPAGVLGIILGLCLALLTTVLSPAFADVSPVGDTRDEASGRPQRIIGCEKPEDRRVTFQMQTYEWTGSILRASGNVVITGKLSGIICSILRASGNVRLRTGVERLTASSAEYNTANDTGTLKDATFTTCANSAPDYHLAAREISLLGNNRIRAKGIGLYIGNFRVLALPFIKLRVGGRSATRHIFPRPGFDQADGFTLAQDFRLIDDDRLRTNADLRFTSRMGVQGQIYSIFGFDGDIIDLPGRYLTFDSLRSGVLELPPQTDVNCQSIAGPDPRAARLTGFGTFTLRQRTYNINNTHLAVYRQPELGMTYTASQINLTGTRLDPRLEIYPQAITNWGLFRESPGAASYTGRTTAGVISAINILPLGPNTAVQPVLGYDWSGYSNGDNYRVGSIGMDASHLWGNGSIGSVRYIKRHESGRTPFQFDRVEINQELQSAVQVQYGKYVAGLVVGYNFDNGSVYDWEVMYGWRTDCLGTSVRYDHRLQRLSLGVSLMNL